MHRNLLFVSVFASLIACAADPQPETGRAHATLYRGPTDKFFPVGAYIPTCWATPGWPAEKARVEAAIASSWLTQANLNVTFEPTCPTQDGAPRVRIEIGVHGDASAMGGNGQAYLSGPDALTGPDGVAIRFWFRPDRRTSLGRIDYLAVHEFGHVLGFAHEQDQASPGAIACRRQLCESEAQRVADSGGTFDVDACLADADDNEGGEPIGGYDPNSIMNYCARGVGTNGRLSDSDGVAVRRVYGKRTLVLDESEPAASVVHANGDEVAVLRAPDGSVTFLAREKPGQYWFMNENLGGQIVGTPVVASLGADVYVFARGVDDAIWYKHRDANGFWLPAKTDWISLGGTVSARPAVASSSNGRLDLFVRGRNGDVYHKAFYGNAWVPSQTAWQALGGYILGAPAAVSVGANQPQVFAVGGDHALVRMGADDWGRFEGRPWEYLGGWVQGTPAVASPTTGQVVAVVRGGNDALYTKRFNGVSWAPSQLGYDGLGRNIVGSPALASDGHGRVDLFAQDLVGQLIHTWAEPQSAMVYPPRPPAFTGIWDELGGLLYGSPAAYSHAESHDAVTRGANNQARSRSWSGETWQAWNDMNASTDW